MQPIASHNETDNTDEDADHDCHRSPSCASTASTANNTWSVDISATFRRTVPRESTTIRNGVEYTRQALALTRFVSATTEQDFAIPLAKSDTASDVPTQLITLVARPS